LRADVLAERARLAASHGETGGWRSIAGLVVLDGLVEERAKLHAQIIPPLNKFRMLFSSRKPFLRLVSETLPKLVPLVKEPCVAPGFP